MWYEWVIDNGLLPDFIMKQALKLISRHKFPVDIHSQDQKDRYLNEFSESLKHQPIALRTDDTKRQHYEVPTDFFIQVLGSLMKYSCCYWKDENAAVIQKEDLDRAEEDMLAIQAERAGIEDGMSILDLGCGWGSLSIYLARKYPETSITAVSHSSTQKEWITKRAAELNLGNIEVITADMNDFETSRRYDRIVSIEMFEHMRNWHELFHRISSWLKDDGRVFIHIFTVEGIPYFFDADNDRDWMAKNFFAGGMMPSPELASCFPDHLTVEKTWRINGTHYAKTLYAWLKQMDKNKEIIMPVMKQTYGRDAKIWWNRWRLFFLSSAVVFGYANGTVWDVTHFLMKKSNAPG